MLWNQRGWLSRPDAPSYGWLHESYDLLHISFLAAILNKRKKTKTKTTSALGYHKHDQCSGSLPGTDNAQVKPDALASPFNPVSQQPVAVRLRILLILLVVSREI